MVRLRVAVLCLLVLLLSASSCKDPRVDRVTIDSGDITLAVGETHALTATADAQFGANPAIAWSSADAGVATVTSGGVVRGVAVGTTEIVARSVFDPSKRDEIRVTVVASSAQWTLLVSRSGSGSGSVVSSPAGIDCGGTCAAEFAEGTSVTLTATAAVSSVFSGWSGACTGSAATCTVSMTQARNVTATFQFVMVPMHPLTVTRAGQGSGTVSSSPAGIDCGSACSAMFVEGTSVTLTATPAVGHVFSGWSGACTGSTATCTVSMTQARSVTATFGQLVILPLNDNFAYAQLLTGMSGSTQWGNRGASKETGEPNHAYTAGAWNEGGKSVWWRWTAPYTGGVVFDTLGSSFDTMLGVYTGSAVHQLTSVGYNDDAPSVPGLQSRLVFPVISGVTYRIAVDGFRSTSGTVAEGDITLNWDYQSSPEGPPLNDNFSRGFVMRGSSGRTTGTNMLATKESGEPNHYGANGASVWWVWTAPSTGSVTISTFDSNFDTVLAVYTGSAVNGLTWIANNDDSGGTWQSRVTFTASGGTTYRIAVDGFKPVNESVKTGLIVLNWGP